MSAHTYRLIFLHRTLWDPTQFNPHVSSEWALSRSSGRYEWGIKHSPHLSVAAGTFGAQKSTNTHTHLANLPVRPRGVGVTDLESVFHLQLWVTAEMCRPTLDQRHKAAGSGSWSVTAGPAVTHRAHIIHFIHSLCFILSPAFSSCVQNLSFAFHVILNLYVLDPTLTHWLRLLEHATCWMTDTTAPIRLPWPLAVSAPAAQYGRLWSSVDCRDDVSVHRLTARITTAVYMHLTEPLCGLSKIHLSVWNSWKNLHFLPCVGDRGTILHCPHRYDIMSSSIRGIFALYLWSRMWQIRTEEDIKTAKWSSRIQMREKRWITWTWRASGLRHTDVFHRLLEIFHETGNDPKCVWFKCNLSWFLQ